MAPPLVAQALESDAAAVNRLAPLLYEELRRLARRHMDRQRRGHTLSTTDLINEASKDGAGYVLRITGLEFEEIERIPPSEGDRLLYARVKELGLSESADLLLKGEELVLKNTRHRWPLP